MSRTSWQAKYKYDKEHYGTIGVKLPKDFVAAFKDYCAQNGRTQAQVVKEAIRQYTGIEAPE